MELFWNSSNLIPKQLLYLGKKYVTYLILSLLQGQESKLHQQDPQLLI